MTDIELFNYFNAKIKLVESSVELSGIKYSSDFEAENIEDYLCRLTDSLEKNKNRLMRSHQD